MEGLRFGRWLVTKRGENYIYPQSKGISKRYICICDCGKVKLVHAAHLKNGSSTSCGCYPTELSTTHGLSQTRAYKAYHHMVKRCGDKAHPVRDKLYIEQKITVCKRWLEPELRGLLNFVDDLGECPPSFELERKDGSLGYFPENCCWASEITQATNRRTFSNNTSGRSGVTWSEQHLKWRANIQVAKVKHEGGLYENIADAISAREHLEIKYLGGIKYER